MAPFKLPFAPASVMPDFLPLVPVSVDYHPTAIEALKPMRCPMVLLRALLGALNAGPVAMVDLATFETEGGILPSTAPWRHIDPENTLLAVVQVPGSGFFVGVALAGLATTCEARADEITSELTRLIRRPVLCVRRARFAMAEAPVVLQ